MIGDGIATDLAAARAVGARCVLMLTGVTTRAEVEALPRRRAADRDRRRSELAAPWSDRRGRRRERWRRVAEACERVAQAASPRRPGLRPGLARSHRARSRP